MGSILNFISSFEELDHREWICRRCHEWCETIGPATYCPKCGKETLDDATGEPWSTREKIVFWSIVAAAVVGLYLTVAWFVSPTDYQAHWWPFNKLP